MQWIRHKRLIADGFNDRVATRNNVDSRFVDECWTMPLVVTRYVSKRTKRIELG